MLEHMCTEHKLDPIKDRLLYHVIYVFLDQ